MLPIDTAKIQFVTCDDPRVDVDDKNVPKTDRDGVIKYRVRLVAMTDEHGAEILSVKVAGEPKGVKRQMAVTVHGLAVGTFPSPKGGTGLWYSADSIEPATTASARQS